MHPAGYFPGKLLLRSVIVFDDIKLSTTDDTDPRYIVVQPFQIYQIVIQLSPINSFSNKHLYSLSSMIVRIPELQFLTVRKFSK